MKTILKFACICSLALSAPNTSFADKILGTWLSPPDKKGQTGHVMVTHCGDAFCGRLVRTYDKNGAPITTKNTGLQIFWGMKEISAEAYRGGHVYVPIMGKTFAAKLDVKGANLHVRGCVGPVCKKQVWTRVR